MSSMWPLLRRDEAGLYAGEKGCEFSFYLFGRAGTLEIQPGAGDEYGLGAGSDRALCKAERWTGDDIVALTSRLAEMIGHSVLPETVPSGSQRLVSVAEALLQIAERWEEDKVAFIQS